MNTDETSQSFLSRWSRRKAQVRQGSEPPEVQPPPPVDPGPADDTPAAALAAEPAPPAAEAPPAAPRPTLDDVQALTRESDFSRFVAPDVDPEVNADPLVPGLASRASVGPLDKGIEGQPEMFMTDQF